MLCFPAVTNKRIQDYLHFIACDRYDEMSSSPSQSSVNWLVDAFSMIDCGTELGTVDVASQEKVVDSVGLSPCEVEVLGLEYEPSSVLWMALVQISLYEIQEQFSRKIKALQAFHHAPPLH